MSVTPIGGVWFQVDRAAIRDLERLGWYITPRPVGTGLRAFHPAHGDAIFARNVRELLGFIQARTEAVDTVRFW